jgi:hypothetical protein
MADMERITFRASPKFKRELEAAAKQDHRNLSSQVRQMLHEKLVELKEKK